LPAGVTAAFSHPPSFHEPFARISAAQHCTSSVSSPAASETQTPEPGLCLPALPPVGPTDYESTPSLTRLSAVRCAPEGTPCRTRRVAPHAPPLVRKVGEDVDNQDNGKRVSSQSISQDGLDCTGSPPSTLKRKLSTLDRPALGEGVFTFDVFGGDDGDDGDDGHCSSRPAKRPARVIPPVLQSKTRPPPLRHRQLRRTVAIRAKPRGRVRRRSLNGVAASAKTPVSLQDSGW
jgi:hypothetical protein